MRTLTSTLLCTLAALCPTALAGTSPRDALEFFNDSWTVEGQEAAFVETCEWLPGRGFVACHADDRTEATPSYSMSVFGYSDADGHYTYSGFGGSGTQRVLSGFLNDGVWHFQGQSGRGPNWRRWQVTLTPTARGFHFREEVSDRSGPWREVASFEYLRRSKAGN